MSGTNAPAQALIRLERILHSMLLLRHGALGGHRGLVGVVGARAPAQIPRASEEVVHALDGDAFGLWHPDAEDEQAEGTDDGVEDVGAPDVERDEHVGGDADDGELEEPMQAHADGVAHVADAGWEDLGAVEVGDCTEADRPADGVHEDGRDGCV